MVRTQRVLQVGAPTSQKLGTAINHVFSFFFILRTGVKHVPAYHWEDNQSLKAKEGIWGRAGGLTTSETHFNQLISC